MIFRRKFSKKEQKWLEQVKAKENMLKSLERSVEFLESQYRVLENKNLTDDEYDFESRFLVDKIEICKNRRNLCKKELDLLKSEGGFN